MAGNPSDHAAEGAHRVVFEDVMGDCASIFIGDMVTAFRALEPAGTEAEHTRRAIIELLGLHVGESEIAGRPAMVPPSESPSPSPAKAEPERKSETADSTENDEAPPLDSSTTVEQWMPSILETQKISTPLDAGLLKFPALPPPEPAASELTKGAAPDPLLEPAWSRAILTALTATWRDGEIDIESLIERVAHREHITQLPRVPLPTLRRGAQLLIDTSTGMTPFFSDQVWVLKEMERLLGSELLDVQTFVGLPTRGMGAPLMDEEQPYVAPLPGTPVILLSDLGIARPLGRSDRAGVEEWATFAKQVGKANCPLVALLPYPPARWPRGLHGLITMVHWDPRTSAGRLRAIIGRAHHVA